jgi:divalent anion:Na+ symporter, DASS family
MSSVVASPAPLQTQVRSSKWIWLAVAAIIGGIIVALPTPEGLTKIAQMVLAITAFTVVLWAAQVMNSGVASVLLMALLILVGVPVPRVFSGFAGGAFWTLLAVLFYGFAMKKTGLAERLSYYILSLFPGTYPGILTAFFVIGFVLALGIPSMTVRTAIMTPIAWALVQSLGLPPFSRGSALIIVTTVEMAVVPGIAFLYGSLAGPIVAKSFDAKHIPLTWTSYAQVITFPTLLLCALILIGNQFVLRPEAPLKASASFAKDRLKALGSFKRQELITGIIVVLSIVFWITTPYKLPSFFIGMIAMAVFNLTGIVQDQDIATGVSWTLLLFLGGIFGLANVIQDYKVTDWMAGFFVPIVQRLTFSTVLLVLVMGLAMFLFRFLDPSSFIAIAVLFLAVVDVTSAVGIPPLVLMAALMITSVPFWMLYQNFWLAMGEGLTGNQACTNSQRMRLAHAHAVFALISLAVAVGYWKLIGILH